MAFDIGKEISTQVKTRVFKKVTGGIGDFIRGIPGIGNSSELGKLATRQKSNVDHLSFPIDVESDTSTGNHGHYIIFYINEQEDAQIKFGEERNDGQRSVIEEVNRRKIPSYIRKLTSRSAVRTEATNAGPVELDNTDYELKRNEAFENLIDGFATPQSSLDYDIRQGLRQQLHTKSMDDSEGYKTQDMQIFSTYNGINVKRKPTKRLKTAISMYMPPEISTSYGVGYTDTEIGLFTEQAQNIISSFGAGMSGKADQNRAAIRDAFSLISDEVFGGGVEAMLTQLLLATADAVPGLGGSSAVFGMRQGKVFSPRMEVAFQGLEKRKFQYTFKMTPRSSREAEEIRAIIFAFKLNMLPEIDNDFTAGRRMIVPNTFDISYMYSGGGMASENEFLHKISTCVLENLDVKYGGGNKYQTFQGGDNGAPVVETTITLSFKELETITRERAREGF